MQAGCRSAWFRAAHAAAAAGLVLGGSLAAATPAMASVIQTQEGAGLVSQHLPGESSENPIVNETQFAAALANYADGETVYVKGHLTYMSGPIVVDRDLDLDLGGSVLDILTNTEYGFDVARGAHLTVRASNVDSIYSLNKTSWERTAPIRVNLDPAATEPYQLGYLEASNQPGVPAPDQAHTVELRDAGTSQPVTGQAEVAAGDLTILPEVPENQPGAPYSAVISSTSSATPLVTVLVDYSDPASRPATDSTTSGSSGDVYYASCRAVRYLQTPLTADQPGYRIELDTDGNGIACDENTRQGGWRNESGDRGNGNSGHWYSGDTSGATGDSSWDDDPWDEEPTSTATTETSGSHRWNSSNTPGTDTSTTDTGTGSSGSGTGTTGSGTSTGTSTTGTTGTTGTGSTGTTGTTGTTSTSSLGTTGTTGTGTTGTSGSGTSGSGTSTTGTTTTRTTGTTGTGTSTSTTTTSTSTTSSVAFSTCEAAIAAGKAPLIKGQPGYTAALDTDGDGIACETSQSAASTTSTPIPTPTITTSLDPATSNPIPLGAVDTSALDGSGSSTTAAGSPLDLFSGTTPAATAGTAVPASFHTDAQATAQPRTAPPATGVGAALENPKVLASSAAFSLATATAAAWAIKANNPELGDGELFDEFDEYDDFDDELATVLDEETVVDEQAAEEVID